VSVRCIAIIENWQPVFRVVVCRLRACRESCRWFSGGGGPQRSQLYVIFTLAPVLIFVERPIRKA
jgi:hypothetical protein